MSEGARPVATHVDVGDGWEPDEETGGVVRMVRAGPVMVGLWKPNGVAGRRSSTSWTRRRPSSCCGGAASCGSTRAIRSSSGPGVVVSLSCGARLSWLVDDEFRELWVYS